MIMNIQEQAQKLAEERYSYGTITEHSGPVSYLAHQARINRERKAFVAGFTASKWIPVTPGTMPEDKDIVLIWIEERKMAFQVSYENGKFNGGWGYEIKFWQPLPVGPTH